MTTAADIGKKYGQSIKDFATASNNAIEDILLQHCNEGMRIMAAYIRKRARTGGGSTLAQDIYIEPTKVKPGSITVSTMSGSDYWDYVNKGVKGVKNKGKAAGSPYSFKTIGAGRKMINSFKKYIAATGSKSMSGQSLILKNKRAQSDLITRQAKQMAVATKIGGIRPMRFVSKANNSLRNRELANKLSEAIGEVIIYNITGRANGNSVN